MSSIKIVELWIFRYRILFKHFLLGIHYVQACEEISASGSEATLTCHMGCDHKDVGE